MVVKRVNRKQKEKAFRSSRTKASDFNVSLSDEPSTPSDEIGDYVIWIYSLPGVGKTTFASQFPDIHMFMSEVGGAKAISVHQKPIRHWLEWEAYAPKLRKDKTFKTIAIDILEHLYQLCFDYMCNEVLHIEHPQDQNDFGKSWGKINAEFLRSMRVAGTYGKGLILISHAVEKKIKTFLGEEYEVIRPNLGGSVLQALEGAVDVVGYMYADDKQHYMRIRSNGEQIAKTRLVDHFNWPDGEPIEVIPLGRSSRSAYENFVAAFNNELPRPQTKKVLKKKRSRHG